MVYFAGDVCLADWIFDVGFGVGTKIKEGENPFRFLKRRDGDVWVGNFEGVASSVTIHKGIYAKSFRIEPKLLKSLPFFNYYGIANNHVMEHGDAAYREMASELGEVCDGVFGMKEKPYVSFIHEGREMVLCGMSMRIDENTATPLYWHNPEYAEMEHIVAAMPQGAFKVLYVHWGNEYIGRPSSMQKKFAHWLIDIGFDMIVGMHPHVLQGYEEYNGRRIYYSLGNFVFDMPSEQCKYGAVVGVSFECGEPKYKEEYVRMDNGYCPHIVVENDIDIKYRFSYLNQRLRIDDNTEAYHAEALRGYKVYRNANRWKLLRVAVMHPVSFCGMMMDFIKRKLG